MKPISPNEVPEVHAASIPDEVIEAFNELICENWSPTTKQASFTQKSVMSRILDKFDLKIGERSAKSTELYAKHQLDVEHLFRAEGWKVSYDKPAYNETYDASFKFSAK